MPESCISCASQEKYWTSVWLRLIVMSGSGTTIVGWMSTVTMVGAADTDVDVARDIAVASVVVGFICGVGKCGLGLNETVGWL